MAIDADDDHELHMLRKENADLRRRLAEATAPVRAPSQTVGAAGRRHIPYLGLPRRYVDYGRQAVDCAKQCISDGDSAALEFYVGEDFARMAYRAHCSEVEASTALRFLADNAHRWTAVEKQELPTDSPLRRALSIAKAVIA
jgi:hypothetical protein